VFASRGTGQIFRPPAGGPDKSSAAVLSKERREAAIVRPIGRPMARKTVTLEDLREEFLAHCEACTSAAAQLGYGSGPSEQDRRDQDCRPIILDLAQLNFMDSGAIHCFVRAAAESGRSVVLRNSSP
jgi:hypothetical protein